MLFELLDPKELAEEMGNNLESIMILLVQLKYFMHYLGYIFKCKLILLDEPH